MSVEMHLKSPTPSRHYRSFKARSHWEVIPDSEEERQPQKEGHLQSHRRNVEVIEISSESESEEFNPSIASADFTNADTPYQTPRKKRNRSNYCLKRTIESSSDDSDLEVIEILDRSIQYTPARSSNAGLKVALTTLQNSPHPAFQEPVDEPIITLDQPRGTRTPLLIGNRRVIPSRVLKSGKIHPEKVGIDGPEASISIPNPPRKNKLRSVPGSIQQYKFRPNSKNAAIQAELERRRKYAQKLFNDLNKLVFQDGLPSNTQLNWNKRLLTTAGRAKFHRSKEGIQTTEIELAEKILDCDERIQNTLSHEMCHLATWVIDSKVDENHGRLFKNWARLLMKKRPDIHVSVKHNYEISYPFEWKCEKCAKIYGRFSKSIRSDQCVCGACRDGVLIPLFTTKTPAKKSTKFSRMAAIKVQDSPVSAQGRASRDCIINSCDSGDSEIEFLTHILAVAEIGSQGEDAQ